MQRLWIMILLLAAGCRTAPSDSALIRPLAPAPPADAPAAVGQLAAPLAGPPAAVPPAVFTPGTDLAAITRLPPVTESPLQPAVIQAAAQSVPFVAGARPVQQAVALSAPLPAPGGGAPAAAAPLADLGLSLSQAIDLGLTQNPDFVAVRGQANVSRATADAAKVYPWNPFVQSQFFPNGRPFLPSSTPGASAGLSNYYVWAMQRFELAHQRRYRAQMAAATVTQVQWNIQQAELLNVAQTTRLYFAALYQRELRDLAIETADLNERLLGVVERRFQANLSTAADLTTVKVAARQARRQADLAEATYYAALLALRQQLNLPLDCPLALGQRLTDFAWAPVQELEAPDPNHPAAACPQSLAASLVSARPDLMAASAGVSVAGANMLLSKAARVPDIQAGPIYETADDGTHYLGLRLQSDVPVWNNGTPLLNQRRAELQQQRLSYAQLQERAMLEAQTTIDRYERARRFVAKSAGDAALVAGEAMPLELRQIMDQFAAGQAEVLAVFSTQNSLLQDRRAYLDLLNESAQAAANVVQAAALPPQRLAIDRSTAGPAPLAEPVPPPPLAPQPEPAVPSPR